MLWKSATGASFCYILKYKINTFYLSPAFHVSRNVREYTREETRTDIKLVRVFPC